MASFLTNPLSQMAQTRPPLLPNRLLPRRLIPRPNLLRRPKKSSPPTRILLRRKMPREIPTINLPQADWIPKKMPMLLKRLRLKTSTRRRTSPSQHHLRETPRRWRTLRLRRPHYLTTLPPLHSPGVLRTRALRAIPVTTLRSRRPSRVLTRRCGMRRKFRLPLPRCPENVNPNRVMNLPRSARRLGVRARRLRSSRSRPFPPLPQKDPRVPR